MFIKGFIYRLPHIETDRDVSNAYCRSSSGDNVDLLSRTFYTTVVVSDWCITNRARSSLVGFDPRHRWHF